MQPHQRQRQDKRGRVRERGNLRLVACVLVCDSTADCFVRPVESLPLAVILCISHVPARTPRTCSRAHSSRWLLVFGARHRQERGRRSCGPCLPGLQTLNRKLRIDLNTRKAFLQAIRFGLLREHFVPKGVQVFVHAEDGIRI